MKDSITVGIDFGTTNSFCSLTTKSSSPRAITFPEQKAASFPTAIMYEDRGDVGWSPTEFGRVAEEEWVLLSPEQYSHFRYVCNFKPDLAHSEEARTHARHFLKYLAGKLFDPQVLHGAHLTPDVHAVIGVPARTLADHTTWTEQLASEAGFKNVTTIAEPKGALAYHLYSEHIRLNDLRASVLVVDFGGGTCDFSLLKRGEVAHSWGDPLFGGRLFDDLFYQWLVETNPRTRVSQNDSYIHWVKCRKAKEEFSLKMSRRRDAVFHFHDFLGQGALSGITWQQFTERAEKYEPTPELRRMMEAGAGGRGGQFSNGPLNLVQWFSQSLTEGLNEYGVHQSGIDFAILTGGSSLWPFVSDALQVRLGLSSDKILRANDPQMTVGMGICLLPDLKRRFTAEREKLTTERDVIAQKLMTSIIQQAGETAANIGTEVAKVLCESHLEPALKELGEAPESWSIWTLRKRLEAACWAFEPEMEQVVRRHRINLESAINGAVAKQLQSWLAAHHIRWTLPLSGESATNKTSVTSQSMNVDPSGQIVATVGVVSGIVLSVVSANLLGGTGVALLIAGPVGFFVGLLIGAVLSVAVYIWGREVAQSAVESIPIPAFARGMILPAGTAKIRDRIELDIQEKVGAGLRDEEPRMQAEVERIVDAIIEELNWVNVL